MTLSVSVEEDEMPKQSLASSESTASSSSQDSNVKNPTTVTTHEVGCETKNAQGSESILPLSHKRPDNVVESRRYISVRIFHRIWKMYTIDYASAYKTLFILIVLVNVIAMALTVPGRSRSPHAVLAPCSNAAIANFTVAVSIRQPYMINFFYHGFWRVPRTTSLWLRHTIARLYEYGGVHSGCAISSFIWFCLFAGFLVQEAVVSRQQQTSSETVVCVIIMVMLLTTIIIFALPQMRRRYHDHFEKWHRFGGWVTLGVFWAALVLFQRDEHRHAGGSDLLALEMVKLPITWPLLFLSINAIWPWLMLRKVRVVRTENLSDHAIRIYFDPKEKIIPTHGVAISKTPLLEWHSFAAMNDFDGTAGGSSSIVVSRAGDWTSDAIRNPRPYYYMKGIHMAGPGTMAKIFHRVVFMCTGSGAGPVLAALPILVGDVGLRIIWSTPNPREVFGDKICDALLKADPDAIIWDTRKHRRPDLVEMATRVYQESSAEALFFISNQKLTKTVVGALRRKGVAAFAPIFDS